MVESQVKQEVALVHVLQEYLQYLQTVLTPSSYDLAGQTHILFTIILLSPALHWEQTLNDVQRAHTDGQAIHV